AGSTHAVSLFIRTKISAMTVCGTIGAWKAPPSCGISAARRTSTSGSTWPTTHPWRRTPAVRAKNKSNRRDTKTRRKHEEESLLRVSFVSSCLRGCSSLFRHHRESRFYAVFVAEHGDLLKPTNPRNVVVLVEPLFLALVEPRLERLANPFLHIFA